MNSDLLKISLVTPSYNSAEFLENTILSVIKQGYGDLEYVIVDGGSEDQSLSIIEKYKDYLSWWTSQPDGGQYDAINKGFMHCGGEIMAWLNADDMYLPWTFSVVSEIFSTFPEIEWITTLFPLVWDKEGRVVRCAPRGPYSKNDFFKGWNLPGMGWHADGWIQQEATFWRRSLWERAGGGLDASMKHAGDFELWARFFQHAELYAVEAPLGGFRRHGNQKTELEAKFYIEEALTALHCHNGRPSSKLISFITKLLKRNGFTSTGKICRYDSRLGRWKITE